jgi:hypothetical protein
LEVLRKDTGAGVSRPILGEIILGYPLDQAVKN